MSEKPVFSSMHTHTLFCDGSDDVETLCRAAYEKGLLAIGFSAHGPIFKKTGFKSDWHLPDEKLDEYITTVRAARRRWEGKLEVFVGLEVDYIQGLCSAADPDIRALELDFIISSVHYLLPLNGAEPFTVDAHPEELEQGINEGFGGDGEAMMHAYWDAEAQMIASGGFDIVGHIDLVKKNNHHKRWFSMESEAYRARLTETAQAAGWAASGTGLMIEVNTGGLNRGRSTETYPSASFLRLLRENQVPAIITADAHRADDLDGHYNVALQTLRDAGYTEHLIFTGKTNHRAQWRKVML